MSQTRVSNQNYYNRPIDKIVVTFGTDLEKGLKSSNIEERVLKFGFNELPKIKKSIWRIYLAPIFNSLILILIITAILVIILGSPESTVVTFIVILINSITAITQQYRAQKALESLRKISALKTVVIRDGSQKLILSRDLVPGDLIVIKQGDKIPADVRIFESTNITVNEASLTGESEPVNKNRNLIERNEISMQEQSNMLFMGTFINTGRGKAIVTNIGTNTEIGKISSSLNEMGSIEDIPLTRKLNRLGYILTTVVFINLIILIIFKFVILIYSGNFYQSEISQALVDSILRAMNIVPINLPLLSTLVLITGVLKMAQSGVIIKNLSSIESLGRVSVICADKTGTITKNEMTVEKFWINDKEYDVSGSGYDDEGYLHENGKKINLIDNLTFQKFIVSMIINNNAMLMYEDVKVRIKMEKKKAIRRAIGSPTEAALLVLAEKSGYSIFDIRKIYTKIYEFEFSSELKRMSTISKSINLDTNIFAFVKGAPEEIIEISTQIEINNTVNEFEDNAKNKILMKILENAHQGYRTLGMAYKKMNVSQDLKRENVEKDLIFLGFVSIMDPPRSGVKESVQECQSAGIKVIMITGDHPATAKTIASQMGIYNEVDRVVEGTEINTLDQKALNQVSVFARVNPSNKELIVKNYQDQNKVCAMTGDGINDALALKLSNAGIAMGITGTDIAKETADMVISDDNFTSIEKGVKIGRGLFSKIRVIIYFFICLNIMEASIFFAYEFIPTFELFASNWQHIYIFGIVHSLPSLALVIDKPPKDVMKEPPRNEEELLNKNVWGLLLIHALLMGIGLVLAIQLTLGGIIQLNSFNLNPSLSYIPSGTTASQLIDMKARTMLMTTLYICETTFILSFRRPNKPILKSVKEDFSLTLFIICGFTLLLHILIIVFSYSVNTVINDDLNFNLQLNFMFLDGFDWITCILLAMPGLIGIELVKTAARKKGVIF